MATDRAAQLRLARARVQGTVGLVRLVFEILRGSIDEVWIGDSNSVLFNTSRFPLPALSPVGDRRFVWHVGPRLMYSIATNDFPHVMRRVAGWLSHIPYARRITYVFSFGEIDVRCHLATRLPGADPAFIASYVDRVRGLARILGVEGVVVVTPPPQSAKGLDHSRFPVVGSFAERLAAHRWMLAALVAATERDCPGPAVRLLDVSSALSDDAGCFRPEFTDDGTHTNGAGREVVRREYRAQLPPR